MASRAAVQSMPSLHGRHTPSLELYFPATQTHSIAPLSEVRPARASHGAQSSEAAFAACLPASHSEHLVAYR